MEHSDGDPDWCGISIHALREEGDLCCILFIPGYGHFYPRPPRGGRLEREPLLKAFKDFYPRPPRGGRQPNISNPDDICNFYPRPPRGGRLFLFVRVVAGVKFLSTPSARRATRLWGLLYCLIGISIHALREEGDGRRGIFARFGLGFLSTPSARRATGKHGKSFQAYLHFYPRPPRGGRLQNQQQEGHKNGYFYPRPPRGGRRRI